MESVMGQTEPCVEYSRGGRVIKGEQRAKANKYTEEELGMFLPVMLRTIY